MPRWQTAPISGTNTIIPKGRIAMISKILVPLDGSQLAEKALIYAKTLAQKFEAELLLARILPPVVSGFKNGLANYYSSEFYQQLEREAKIYLNRVREDLANTTLPVYTELLEGSPTAEMILELATDRKVDLIVMTTHGNSGNTRWVYGSVANKVLQGASCSVFLVR